MHVFDSEPADGNGVDQLQQVHGMDLVLYPLNGSDLKKRCKKKTHKIYYDLIQPFVQDTMVLVISGVME